MRVLITGAGGQLGMEWIDYCRKHEVAYSGFTSGELDITEAGNAEKIIAEYEPDAVINCAAYTKVDAAEQHADRAFAVNAEAPANLAQICGRRGVRLVHYSTDYVFEGSAEDRLLLPEGYPEDYGTKPQNVYGSSKRAGEEAIIKSGCEYLILRTSWLCGRHGHNFVKTMLRLAKEGKTPRVVNDQFGSPSFAENVVGNTFSLLKQGVQGICHISSSGECSWHDFACEIFRQKGFEMVPQPVSSAVFAAAVKRPAFSKLNTKKLSKIEGTLIESWQDGLKKLLGQI